MERYDNGYNTEQLDGIIDKKLISFNLQPLSEQNENIVAFLRRIEYAIQFYEEKRSISVEEYKKCKINQLKISQATGISRVTINTYKNILGEYIDKTIEIQKIDDLFQRINGLKNTIVSLTDIISKMQVRDVIIENQSIEIEELNNDMLKSEEVIKNLNMRNEQLIKEISEAKKELNSYKNSYRIKRIDV